MDYIEGGDIVHEHMPHHMDGTPIEPSDQSDPEAHTKSSHTLLPVKEETVESSVQSAEEKESDLLATNEEKGDNSNENNASDGGSVTPGKGKSVLLCTIRDNGRSSPDLEAIKIPVTRDTAM